MKMKKVYLLIILCLVGMIVPQMVLAESTEDNNVTFVVSDDGKTITITSHKAGALSGLKFNGNHNQNLITALENSAGGKIVFVGDFCEDDLKFLNGQGQHNSTNYCNQKVVDMSDAIFVKKGTAAETYLYKTESDRQSQAEGAHCIVGSVKYRSEYGERSWKKISEEDLPEGRNWETVKWGEDELPNKLQYYQYDNVYLKVPTDFNYYLMVITKDENNNDVRTWYPVEDPNTIPSDAVVKSADFDESNLQNRTDFCNDGEYIRFGKAPYACYTNPATLTWVEKGMDYNNGEQLGNREWYSSYNALPEPTEIYQEVFVGGNEFVRHNSNWVDPSSVSTPTEYNYTQMHFDFWGSNVEEIITSNHVGENDALPLQLCNNCSNLKKLTLGSGSFNELGNNVNSLQTVDVKKDVTGLGKDMFSQKSSLTKLTFEEGGNKPLTIGQGCFEQCTGLTGTISLPKRISEIGADAFKSTTGVEEVVFNEPSNLTTIHSGTFAESGIKRVTIPKSVTLIETNAFQGNTNTTRLEEVTFQGGNTTPLVIKTGAFQNCVEIKDVYVNVKPSERLLICEYNAFDFKGMEGQTVQESDMTTLHFLEENFDYYAGEWKKGMAIKQSNLNAFKDGIEIRDDNGTLLYEKANTQDPGAWGQYGYGAIEHYDNVDGYYHTNNSATKYAPANGWQQFAKTASPREVLIPGNVYMTYSTATPYSLPKGIIAFRVTDYKEAETDAVTGKTIKGRLVLKMIDQVPTETGMLLISTDQYLMDANGNRNAAAPSKFYFGDPVGTPQIYHYTMGHAGDDTSNYLAPAVHGIEVGPVSKGEPNAVTGAIDVNGRPFTHRNFAMNKSSHQFVRVKHIIMPDNRAFLSLPISMFTNDNESASEGPNPWNTQAGDAFNTYDETSTDPYSNTGNSKSTMFFEYDVEKYGMIWPLAQNEDVTDGIDEVVSNSNAERVQQGIFTLQGVKVDSPTTKGIYIVNGKKVIIK